MTGPDLTRIVAAALCQSMRNRRSCRCWLEDGSRPETCVGADADYALDAVSVVAALQNAPQTALRAPLAAFPEWPATTLPEKAR